MQTIRDIAGATWRKSWTSRSECASPQKQTASRDNYSPILGYVGTMRGEDLRQTSRCWQLSRSCSANRTMFTNINNRMGITIIILTPISSGLLVKLQSCSALHVVGAMLSIGDHSFGEVRGRTIRLLSSVFDYFLVMCLCLFAWFLTCLTACLDPSDNVDLKVLFITIKMAAH